MNAPNARDEQFIDDNPFPRPSADPWELGVDVVSVPTPAIDEAMRLLDAHLAEDGTEGVVLAVSGDYGTGKTHLAAQLLRKARSLPGDEARYAYVGAQEGGGGFHTLYRGNFLATFNRDDVIRHIREYYAHIVADSLENTGFPAQVTRRLRELEIDPQHFVTQFNLAESTFLQRLNADLAKVTRNEEYGTALMLLLRNDLADQVWEWLRGEEPDPLLRERGITSRIDDEPRALEAMGVLALLYRGRSRHFVLVFDELEKVLPSSSRPPAETIAAFRALTDLATRQGIFLVLCGLPEFLEAIGQNNTEHTITATISTDDGLSTDQVLTYIRGSMASTRYGPGLGPFSADIVQFISLLAGGNARRVVQICQSCYRMSLESRRVDRSMVRRAAKGRSEVVDERTVRQQIGGELQNQAREYHTDHPVGGEDGPRVPYWVPVYDTGCAIFLTDSVMDDTDAQRLISSARAVRTTAPRVRTALIVNGFVVDTVRRDLEDGFSEPPLIYARERFSEDFELLLRRLTGPLEATEDETAVIRANISRLAAAQTNAQRYMEQLALQVQSMRDTTERQYAALARDLQDLDPARRRRPLPEDVEMLFTEAVTELKALTGLDAALSEMFGAESPGSITGVLLRLHNSEAVRTVGVAKLTEAVITAFRTAVEDWHGQLDGPPSARQLERLTVFCRAFDTVLEDLPIYQLNTLGDLLPRSSSRTAVIEHHTRSRRQTDMYGLLSELGHRVRQAFAGAGPGGLHGH
ncbi:ATP-binding protein [Actinoallomurus sp. NBC_01490]|uniref:hypothetical protein n=1 Tax=Actinoallomurus sp. NBC_01490 TaxID=2903557 RepID=UPI002E32435D|nr:hypothetical protein [Actinoallomurus sp. NBC_01490]